MYKKVPIIRCTTPSTGKRLGEVVVGTLHILFVGGRDQCGLKVRNLITLWKQQQHIKLSLLESSSDERCRLIAEDLARRQSE